MDGVGVLAAVAFEWREQFTGGGFDRRGIDPCCLLLLPGVPGRVEAGSATKYQQVRE